MQKQRLIVYIVFILTAWGICTAQEKDSFLVRNIGLDRQFWGLRDVLIDIKNDRDDSVKVDLEYYWSYPEHYLSHLEDMSLDTSWTVPPHVSEVYSFPIEIPGTFDRCRALARIFWTYTRPDSGEVARDSTFQYFRMIFIPSDEGSDYSFRKFSVGPIYNAYGSQLLWFEFDRVFLYLLARGTPTGEIEAIFKNETAYSDYLIDTLKTLGYYATGDTGAPKLLTLSEREGIDVRKEVESAADAFVSWYREKGSPEIDQIMDKAGLSASLRTINALRMKILYNSMMADWRNENKDFVTSVFIPSSDKSPESLFNIVARVYWIYDGGDYLLPKSSLAEFKDGANYYLASFSTFPMLRSEKEIMREMREQISAGDSLLPAIRLENLEKALDLAGDRKLTEEIFRHLENSSKEISSRMPHYDESLKAHLADYLFRYAIGRAFEPAEGTYYIDAVKITE